MGTNKLPEYLMGTTTDWTLVDSGEGTYVWDYSEDACPDKLVNLYRGRIKVLTNSTATFTDGTAIVSRRDKNHVAGLELKETMILCRRAVQTTHIKNIVVFFHPMEQIEMASGGHGGRVHQVGIVAELLAGQVNHDAAGDNSPSEGRDMRGSEADRSHAAGEHRRGREPLPSHAGVQERTSGYPQWSNGECDQVPGHGGAAENPHQLHQRDSSGSQQDERVRRSD
jgi:hypothetical protein